MRTQGYISVTPRPDGLIALICKEPELRCFVVPKEDLIQILTDYQRKKGDILSAFLTTERYGPLLPEISVQPSLLPTFLKTLTQYEIR